MSATVPTLDAFNALQAQVNSIASSLKTTQADVASLKQASSSTRNVIMNFPAWQTVLPDPANTQVLEARWFAAHVKPDGTLDFQNYPLDRKQFTAAAKKAGAFAMLSLGGSSQNALDLAAVANSATRLKAFLANLAAELANSGFDGACLDFEDDAVRDIADLAGFTQAIRTSLPGKRISADVQNYLESTVWANFANIEPNLDCVSSMDYDEGSEMAKYPTKLAYVQARSALWPAHPAKFFPGVAISGSANENFTASDVQQIAAWARSQNFGGLMVWNILYMNAAYWTALKG
jgi:spore germination protein YaaH